MADTGLKVARYSSVEFCGDWIGNLLDNYNPDKWNSGTANSCKTDYHTDVIIEAYDGSGNLQDRCSSGTLGDKLNWTQCQIAINRGANWDIYHRHGFKVGESGAYFLSFLDWATLD